MGGGGGLEAVLRVLQNEVNRSILALLSTGSFNPRELARQLGRDETDVSRRLRRLEEAGLVEAQWARVGGRNVRLYRLRSGSLVLRFTSSGVVVELGGGRGGCSDDPQGVDRLIATTLAPPRPPEVFVGRGRELSLLRGSDARLVLVYGLPGVGKTTLVAKYLEGVRGAKVWYRVSRIDSARSMLWRLSVHLALMGYRDLYNYTRHASSDDSVAVELLARGLDSLGATLVVDDVQASRDPGLYQLLADLAGSISAARLIVVSRSRLPQLLSATPRSLALHVSGLGFHEALELLRLMGVELGGREAASLYAATQGHPLLLQMFAEMALQRGVEEALRVVEEAGLNGGLWESLVGTLSPQEERVLDVLLCVDAPLDDEALASVCGVRETFRALRRLSDMGLVEKHGGRYSARDLVRRIGRPSAPCGQVAVRVGDHLLSRGDVDSFLAALHVYIGAGSEQRIARALAHRLWVVRQGIMARLGDYEALLRRALGVVRRSETRALVLMELATPLIHRGEYEEALRLLREARRVFARLGNRAYQAIAGSRIVFLYPNGVTAEEAEELIREGLELAKSLKPPRRYSVESGVYANAARFYTFQGRLEEALKAIEGEEAAARMTGVEDEAAVAQVHKAVILYLLGRRREALEEAEEAYAKLLTIGSGPGTALASWVLAEMHLSLGNSEEAARLAKDAVEFFEEASNKIWMASAYSVRLAALLTLGAHSLAAAEAEHLLEALQRPGKSPAAMGVEEAYAAAAAALAHRGGPGDIEKARTLVEAAAESLAEHGQQVNKNFYALLVELLKKAGLAREAELLARAAGVAA